MLVVDYATASASLVLSALVLIVGALLVIAGPDLARSLRGSAVERLGHSVGNVVEGRSAATNGVQGRMPGRGRDTRTALGTEPGAEPGAPSGSSTRSGTFTRPEASTRRTSATMWAGVVLASVVGLAVGLSPGADAVVAVALMAAVAVLGLLLWRPEVALLVIAVFPWVDWVARSTLGGLGPAWDDGLLVISVILVAWAVLVLRRGRLWTVPILVPALLAFAAALGSVVVRAVPTDVAVFALRVLFQPLLFYFVGFLLPKDRRWVQWTIALFLLSSVGLALHGLFQYVTNAPMPASWVDVRETEIGTRAYSVIENPNGLGAFLLIGTLISLSLALAPRLPGRQRWLMAGACVVQVAGVAVTFSRGAWLGLAAGVVALFILAYRRYLAPLVAAGVLTWFLAPSQFTNRLSFAFSSAYITKSMAAGRLYVWNLSLQHVWEHPLFGLGLGTFGGTAAVRFGYGRLWVDNFYLQLAAEGGLILLGLFLWVLLRAAKALVRAHADCNDPYLRALAAGAFGAFMAVAVANFTASVWETLVVGAGFWFVTGLATSVVFQTETADEPMPAGAPRARVSETG